MKLIDKIEHDRALVDGPYVDFYTQAVDNMQSLREEYDSRLNVVKWDQMPMERSPDGLIKHIINEKMNTKECCLDIYMQFIETWQGIGQAPPSFRRSVSSSSKVKGMICTGTSISTATLRWNFPGPKNPRSLNGSREISSTSHLIAPTSILTQARRNKPGSS